jgi:hypothetical protein
VVDLAVKAARSRADPPRQRTGQRAVAVAAVSVVSRTPSVLELISCRDLVAVVGDGTVRDGRDYGVRAGGGRAVIPLAG